MKSRGLALRSALLLAFLLWPTIARGQPPAEENALAIVYFKGGTLWRAPLDAPDKSEKLLELPGVAADVRDLFAADDGSAVLLDVGANAAWIDLSVNPPKVVWLPCRRARLSANGQRVLCTARGAQRGTDVVLRLRPTLGATPLLGFDSKAGLGQAFAADRVLGPREGGLWLSSVGAQDGTRATTHVPVDGLLASPSGQRAVGRYDDDDRLSLFSFRLDGQGARRRLGIGVPVVWSGDSEWLALASRESACLVRSIGGEYKCWDDFTPLAISHDGRDLLLAKRTDSDTGRRGGDRDEDADDDADDADDDADDRDTDDSGSDARLGVEDDDPPPRGEADIYHSVATGARSKRPVKILDDVSAATLLPAPAAPTAAGAARASESEP